MAATMTCRSPASSPCLSYSLPIQHITSMPSFSSLLSKRAATGSSSRLCEPPRSLSRPVPPPEAPPHSQPHLNPRALPLHPELSQIIFSSEVIEARVAELGRLIGTDYQHEHLLVLGVLKGAFMFTTDLVRHVYPWPASVEVDFFKASSYGNGTTSSGVVQLDSAFQLDSVRGKHVLLVEDIIDTGNTLSRLVALMKEAGAASVRVAALLDKKARRRVPFEADYTGFECPDEFIVGYGIDYAEKYRNLPYIGAVSPEFIQSQN